jgi:hypothetical protein
MNDEVLNKLYQSAIQYFDMPSYDEFVVDMRDESKLATFRESMMAHYDMPDINTFKNDIGFSSTLQDEVIKEPVIDVGDEKKNPEVTPDPDLPSNQPSIVIPPVDGESTPSTESSLGFTENDITSESFLDKSSFASPDVFTGTVLSDERRDPFNAAISSIDREMFGDREEEQVVPELNYKFGQYGFKFEETGIGDRVRVTSADGKTETFGLDSFGVPLVDALEIGAKRKATALKKFLTDNKENSMLAFAKGIEKEQVKLNKIQNEKELKSLVALFNYQEDNFAKDVKNYTAEKLRLNRIYQNSFAGVDVAELKQNPNYQLYLDARERVDMARNTLVKRRDAFAAKGEELDKMVGEYTLMRSEGGGDFAQSIELSLNTFLEGAGTISVGFLESIGSYIAPKILNLTGKYDANEGLKSADDHVDFAVAELVNNTQGFNLDDLNILSSENREELTEIKELIGNNEKLDVIQELQLKELLSSLNPNDLQVVLENIETSDGYDLHSLTKSIYEDVQTKAIREYEDSDVQVTVDGRPDIIGNKTITRFDKAKSAALGGASMANPFTGSANYLNLEEGLREKFNKVFNRYIGQETSGDMAYRKALMQTGPDLVKGSLGAFQSIPSFLNIYRKGGKFALKQTKKYGAKAAKKQVDKLNKSSRILRLMTQSMDAQMEKMANNPRFDNIDLDEQRAIAAPVAIATAVLEDVGFRNLVNNKGFINGLVARTISKLSGRGSGKKISTKTFADFVRKDINQLIKNPIAAGTVKGGLTLANAYVVEFETGLLQRVVEISSEQLYNKYKRDFDDVTGKMFDTPDSATDYIKDVVYNGYLEAIGGLVLGVPTAVATAVNKGDMDLISDEMFEYYNQMLEDPQNKKMWVTNLKRRVADKNDPLTQEEAKEQLEAYNTIEGLMPQIPTDFTVKQSREALNLLMEKQNLLKEIEGKAPELVKKQKDRIAEIDLQMQNITLKASQEQEAAAQAEASIPEFNSKSKTKEQQQSSESDVTQEEQDDIEEAFGDQEISVEETVEENLFFNRKGKSKEKLSKEKVSMRNKVINKATNAAKSLAKNIKTKIVLHESSDEFNKATGREGRGFYDFNANTIHIDMNKANETTIAHEAFHAALYQKLGDKNIGQAIEMMTKGVMNAVDKNSMLYKKADSFSKLYKSEGATVQNEERLAELFGEMAGRYQRLDAPAQNAIVNFVKKAAKTIGLDKIINIGNITTKDDADVVNLLNTLADKVSQGQEIFTNDLKILEKNTPYTEGAAVQVNNKAKPVIPEGRETKTRVYKGKEVSNLPIQTMDEFARAHDGNVYAITSDASGPELMGGFYYAALKENNENGVGFASLDPSIALRNMKKLKSKYPEGTRVGVTIMIQSPDAMFGNKQGSQYFYDSIVKIQKRNPKAYKDFAKDLASKKNSRMGRPLTQATQEMIMDPQKVTREQFLEQMEQAESFETRRYYIQNIIPSKPNLKTNKSTAAYVKALLESGVNAQVFNEKFGDKKLLGSKFLRDNKGGFLAGGFTYVVPESTRTLVEDTQRKGVTHPFFKGKVPSVPNSTVIFDGLYPVSKTLQPYMPVGLIADPTKIAERDARVREQFSEDKFYVTQRIENKPRDERNYTDLKPVNKTLFKNSNKDLMLPNQANANSMIAQSKMPLFEQITEEIDVTPRGREQKEIVDIINEGRNEYNFRDEVIKDFLVRRKGYPASVVNKLLNVDVDLFNTLPNSFKNIQGGVEAGVRLYKRVKAYEQKLIKGNKRKKVKLTEQQIADQTIEYLQKQPEYIKEGDGTNNLTTRQATLQIEFQKSVGTRASENVQEKLTEARRMVQQRKRGAKNLQQAKAAIRNFIRKSLPVDIYSRSEVMSLVRKVTDANQSNIENIFDEVLEFVNKKNNARLEKKIEDILNGKYETKQSGRKKAYKISLNIKERIQRIKKDRLGVNATSEEIDAVNELLTQEFNKIAAKSQTTEGDFSRMVDLQILINLNNSLQMENTDVNKTGSLDVALATLQEMIDVGRSELKQQLEDSHKKYNKDASIAYEEVTGEETDLGDKDVRQEVNLKNEKRLNAKRNKLKGVVKKFINTINVKVKKFFNQAEALDGLMDLISTLPGEMFGGRLQKIVTGRVDSSSRMFKGRMLMQEEIVANKLEELYGKKWRNKVRAHNKMSKEATYVLDPKAVEEAELAYEKDPSLQNKQNLKQVLYENSVHLSQNEMIYYYNLYKDPANKGSFEATFGKDYARVMEQIESKMEDSVKEFADWQVNEYYPSLYEHYNNTYKALYRTNMPWNRYYSGMIYRNDAQGNPIQQETLDMLSDKSIMNTSVGSSSTKFRVQNNLPIRKMNAMNVMSTYLRDMEYFAAYGESIRDIHKIFTNKQVRDAIGTIHGEYVNKLINDMIGKIANKGIRNNGYDRVINQFQNLFIFSKIGLNPTVMIKQLTSMITYANDIGYRNWLKYSLKNIPQIKKTFKELSNNSIYMQDRNRQSITRVIESYSEDGMIEMVPNQYWDSYVNFIMYTTKFGDKAAIYLGGMPNYLYYKDQALKRGLSEEQAQKEATLKFEKDTKRTQQSMDLQDRDYFQTAGALARGLNMFMTTPKQYLRKEIQSTRNLYRKVKAWDRNAGKGTLGQNLKTFVTYHVIAPSLFQYVSLGLPGLLRPFRPDDEEDMMRAAIVGNLNALFIVGELVTYIADSLQGKPYAGKNFRSIAPLMAAGRIADLAERYKKTKDPKKKQENLDKLITELVSYTSLPAVQIRRMIDNIDELGKGNDIGTDILRLLNFSPYVIEGPKKKSSSKKTLSVQEQNAKYRKEQARKKKQTNDLSRFYD